MTKASQIDRFKGGLVFPAIMLGFLALVAAAALSGGDLLTRDEIRARRQEDLKSSITQVIPAGFYDNDLLKDTIELSGANQDKILVYRARLNGQARGVAFQISEPGYGGDIDIIMGVATDGTLLGVRVLSHSETPGLGDKIEVNKDDWILGFDGRSLDSLSADGWRVKKDGGVFDQFSGATITPRAVVRAVKRGLDFFAANRDLLFSQQNETGK
ncbi:MAG: electron transport complex subunit RsxG [Fimbriimonadaceae bacterium]|nr:electron transport complex subunit RsxG [Alphaproteobacteria bacterium]